MVHDDGDHYINVKRPYTADEVASYHLHGGIMQLMSEDIQWLTEEARERINAYLLNEFNNKANFRPLKSARVNG